MAAGTTYPPDRDGPYLVGVRTVELVDPTRNNRSLTTEIWYPAAESARGQDGAGYGITARDLAGLAGLAGIPGIPETSLVKLVETPAVRDAPPAPAIANNGLVVFSHGYRGVRWQSTFLTVRLASHGYVVVAPDHAGNTLVGPADSDDVIYVNRLADMEFVTSQILSSAARPDHFLHGLFDTRRVGWTGHSFGASTVLVLGIRDATEMVDVPLAPRVDPRMVEVADPAHYELGSAMLVMGGSADHTCDFTHQQTIFDKAGRPRFLAELDGAGHFDFTELCGNLFLRMVPQIGGECGQQAGRYFPAIRYFVVAAMNRYLRCDVSAAGALSQATGRAQTDIMAYTAEP